MTSQQREPANLFEGKTYSLHGPSGGSDDYYRQVRVLLDNLLRQGYALPALLGSLRKLSRSRQRLRRLALHPANNSSDSSLVHSLRDELSRYTTRVSSHLKSLPLTQRWDRTLGTSEEQYHLAMLEVEVVNRMNVEQFRKSDTRLAFLPHCLHDLDADCRSSLRGDDYVCKGCSRGCIVNEVSKLLRRHGVIPYIWMTANLQSLFRRLRKEGKSIAVVGVACLPELVNGMRLCARANVPVIGMPLDANRCARWWGCFYPNTVNIREFEQLLGGETLKKPISNGRSTGTKLRNQRTTS
jgi:hypothetical protein